jgi:hypothetical protein
MRVWQIFSLHYSSLKEKLDFFESKTETFSEYLL